LQDNGSPLFEHLWYFVSLTIIFVWLRKNKNGKDLLARAPLRRNHLQFLDVLMILLLYISFSLAVSKIMPPPENPSLAKQDLAFFIMAVGYVVISIIIIILGRQRFNQRLSGMGLTLKQLGRNAGRAFTYSISVFGITFFTLSVTLMICQLCGYREIQKHNLLDMLEKEMPLKSVILIVTLPAVFAPILEELLFRGLLQSYLVEILTRNKLPLREDADFPDRIANRNRWPAIFIASGIFAVFHGNPQHWPALFILACGLGYVYERRQSLIIPITMHSLFNILVLLATLFSKGQSG